ncbi:MAG TPA: hypothetical protein VF520_09575 [Thermoleophilaceae bacterium]
MAAYPFARADQSCVVVDDHAVELVELEPRRLEDSLVRGADGEVSALGGYCESLGIGRDAVPAEATPVLSYGANASPAELSRKLAAHAPGVVVPLVLTAVHDIDVVYSAHVSPSGGVGAAIQRSPGTVVEMAVAYLGPELLATIDATEVNYDRRPLPDLRPPLPGPGPGPGPGVEAYLTKHGCLVLDGDNVALAAVEAEGRRLPALRTLDAVEAVRALIAPDRTLEEFVVENRTDPELARERTAVLRAGARPFAR